MNNWKIGIKEKSDYILKDLYKFYKNTCSEKYKPLPHKEYAFILKEVNKALIDKVYKGLVLTLPASLGFLGVVESTTKLIFTDEGKIDTDKSTVSTDWGATNRLWEEKPELKHKKYVYHDNSHTDGKRFKIKWSRKYSGLPAIKHYRFKPARSFQRNLALFIKNNPNIEYYEF